MVVALIVLIILVHSNHQRVCAVIGTIVVVMVMILLLGVVVEDTSVNSVNGALHLSVLALKLAVLLDHCIAPGHVVQSDDGAHLWRNEGH